MVAEASTRFGRRVRPLAAFAVTHATLAVAATSPPPLGEDAVGPHDVPTPTIPEIQKERPGDAPKPTATLADAASVEQKKGDGENQSGTVIVPLVVYTPEMQLGIGGLLVQFFRIGDATADSRVSSVAFVALVTTRKQAIFEIHPDFYWDDERNHLTGKFEYQRFPDSFWGIGPHTRDQDEEDYERERGRFRGGFYRRFLGRVYAGVSTDLMLFTARYTDPTGIFETEPVPGKNGGFTGGYGPSVAFDSRDNTVATRSGTLLSSTWLGFARALGSRYEFWKLFTEARQFFPIGKESALGVRYYGEFQAGDVPYYHLAMLGGDELLRGYYMGRYRDKNLVAFEAEYRFPLFWKFGAVTFAGIGDVADRFAQLPKEPIRFAGGGGFRLSLNSKERLNLRLDVGAGPDTWGLYFTAREAF
jgi:hypothetical protein